MDNIKGLLDALVLTPIAMLSLDVIKIAYYVTDNYYYNYSYTSVRLK